MTLKKIIIVLIIFIFISNLIAAESFQTQQNEFAEFDLPPMLWLSENEIEIIKNSKSFAGDKSFDEIKYFADDATKRKPNPADTIFYEGLLSNNPKRIETVLHLHDMRNLYFLSWAYLLTGEDKHGAAAKEYLLSWAEVYKPSGNDVNENKLDICFFTYELLKEKFDKKESAKIKKWFGEIAQKQKENWNPDKGSSNRHAKRLKLIFMASFILNDDSLKSFALEKTNELFETALNSDGTTRDLIRRDAMHYNVGCLLNLLELANILRSFGLDYYNYFTASGASLKNCVEFVLPYAKGEKIYKEWVNTKIEFDRQRALTGDPFYKPGKPWDRFEAIEMLAFASVFERKLIDLAEKLNSEKNPGRQNLLITLVKNITSN